MTTTTTRRPTPAQARKAALESDFTPLYAVAGLTEAVASSVQTAWNDRLGRSEQQAKAAADDLTAFVKSLPEQVKALPETTRVRLAEFQKQAQVFVRGATTTYEDLAGRGKKVVDDKIISARQLSGRAEKRTEDIFADVADAVDPAFEKAQETVTQARKTVTGRTATETTTPRSAQKATATRASRAAKKPAAAKKS
jgi:hypothetical protein